MAVRLASEFAHDWLRAVGFSTPPTGEQAAQVPELAMDEHGLRLTSTYTGSSYCLAGWTGDLAEASAFVRDAAQQDGEQVRLAESRGQGYRRRGPLWQGE